jgi:hypothetical protein
VLGLLFLALVLTLVISHLWWGHRAGARLEAQLAAARAAGEPVTVEELNQWPFLRGGSGENVVPVLRAAAGILDQNDPVWQTFSGMEMALVAPPLKDGEVATLTAVVEKNADVLKKLEGVEATGAVDWQAAYTSPLLNYLMPSSDLNGMRALAQLLHADALLAHRAGDYGRALHRSRQILLISRAVAHQPQIVPHLVALGLSALATTTAGEVVPELQVARAGGPGVSPGQARGLIAELLDERAL